MWNDVLGDDLITRPRLSRIYYRGKFFQYPIEPMNALMGLGIFESIHCGVSYVMAQLFPEKPETNFEAWVFESVWTPSLSGFLQVLHGEGVGHSLPRNRCGLGGAAHQGSLFQVPDHGRSPAQEDAGQVEGHQNPDQ
jgi:hypothetical protein